MCSGRVDLSFVLRAFSNGADGVFIGGCRLNECNYTTHGNYHALNMSLLCKKILERIGLNPERLRVAFMSAGEGILFAEVMSEFSQQLRELGPIGKAEGLEESAWRPKLKEALRLVPYIKVAKREKLALRPEKEEAYADFYTPDEVERLFQEVVSSSIDPEKCQACMICARKCPVEAIEGGKNRIHVIDQEICIKCGTCFEACPSKFAAIRKIVGAPVPDPVPEEARTIVRKGKTEASEHA